MKRYLHNLAIAGDQLANAVTGGDPDETISSRLGKCQRGDYGRTVRVVFTPLAWAVNVLFWWQGWNHCLDSIEEDEGRADVAFRR